MPHIVYIYPEITIKGGADRVIVEKANYLVQHGCVVTIITESQLGREPSFPLHPAVKHVDMGLDFNRQYEYGMVQRLCVYLSLMQQYKRKLHAVLHEEQADIVITALGRSIDIITSMDEGSVKLGESHSVKAHLRSFYLMRRKGFLWSMVAQWMRWLTIRHVAKLDALVLLTQDDAAEWTEARRTFVIPNAAPTIPQDAAMLQHQQAIMVARYNDAKGYDYLIEAWNIVHHCHPEWQLNVYGSGEMHNQVISWIQEKNLSKSIILHEPVDNIMNQYMESSFCVMSSRYEAFPMVLLEAMACGVPCVALDCPHGPRNIIRHEEDGLLVEYLNPQALADSICRLIEDETLRRRLGTNARRNIQRFSKETVMRQWMDLFQQLTQERQS